MTFVFYLVKYKSKDELSEFAKTTIPVGLQDNVTKRRYKLFLETLPYGAEEWSEHVKSFMLLVKDGENVGGKYRIFEIDYNPQYREQFGRMVWEGELSDFI